MISAGYQKIRPWITENNLALFLIFLFPIAITYVRHWASDLFGLLFFVALYYWIRHKTPNLIKEEKLFIGAFLSYFAVFVITSLVNGWTEEQTVWLGLELRFLIIIPIYFMIRQLPDAATALLYGCIIGIAGVFLRGLYEIYILQWPHAINGIYGPLLLGPVTLLIVAVIVPKFLLGKPKDCRPILVLVCVLLGVYVVFNTTARSAYLAFFVVFSLLILINLRGKVLVSVVVALLLSLYLLFNAADRPEKRIVQAYNEFVNYMKADDLTKSSAATTSVGTRLEMWRSLKYYLQDNPLFGVGRGNYNQTMLQYVKQGKLNPSVIDHSHPHNVFVETLISRGVLGLSILLFLLYYPLWFFIKTYKENPVTALTGITHIVAMSVFSLTEASPFIKGNFVATNLVFLSVFFAWHLQGTGRIKP